MSWKKHQRPLSENGSLGRRQISGGCTSKLINPLTFQYVLDICFMHHFQSCVSDEVDSLHELGSQSSTERLLTCLESPNFTNYGSPWYWNRSCHTQSGYIVSHAEIGVLIQITQFLSKSLLFIHERFLWSMNTISSLWDQLVVLLDQNSNMHKNIISEGKKK